MDKKILATVNQKEITNLEVEQIVRSLPPQQAMHYQTEESQKQIVKELVEHELFYLDAVENKFEEEEAFIKEVQRVKEGLLKQYAVSKTVQNVTVTDEEAKAYFEENKENFKRPQMANAKHILVDTEEKANEILTKIKSDLISFEDAAKENSSCPSSASGGDLGEFGRGQMVPEFENATFSMKEGEISEPVQTQFGYHIIKLESLTPETEFAFEEVENNIKQNLLQEKQQKAFEDKIKELYLKYADAIKFL